MSRQQRRRKEQLANKASNSESLGAPKRRAWPITTILLVIAVLGAVSDVAGGFGVLKSAYEFVVGQEQPELDFVNLDSQVGIEFGSSQTSGANLVSFRAVLTNHKSTPVYVTLSRAEANLGTSKCLPEPASWPVLRVNRGIAVEAGLCNISRLILPGQVVQGRIDVLMKYGREPSKLDKELPIKGNIVVTGTSRRLAWMPDGDSATPSGMPPHTLVVPEDETSVNAVADAIKPSRD